MPAFGLTVRWGRRRKMDGGRVYVSGDFGLGVFVVHPNSCRLVRDDRGGSSVGNGDGPPRVSWHAIPARCSPRTGSSTAVWGTDCVSQSAHFLEGLFSPSEVSHNHMPSTITLGGLSARVSQPPVEHDRCLAERSSSGKCHANATLRSERAARTRQADASRNLPGLSRFFPVLAPVLAVRSPLRARI